MEIEKGSREVQASIGGQGKQRERFFFPKGEKKWGEKQEKVTKISNRGSISGDFAVGVLCWDQSAQM